MKYKVLKECICPFNTQMLCPGEVYNWDVCNYKGVTKIIFAAMVQHGSIEEVKNEPWKPKKGDIYYYITSTGDVYNEAYFIGNANDCNRLALGSCFQSVEQAKKAVDWLKAFKVLRDDTKGFKPRWRDGGQAKWYACYDFDSGKLDTECTTLWKSELIHFATEADTWESIKNHRKEWKIFLGVEEE